MYATGKSKAEPEITEWGSPTWVVAGDLWIGYFLPSLAQRIRVAYCHFVPACPTQPDVAPRPARRSLSKFKATGGSREFKTNGAKSGRKRFGGDKPKIFAYDKHI
jgi:hypothetical protein